MEFVFDIDKAIAATAYLANKNGGKLSALFAMKMLYAAEREALATWHRPITGDRIFSMKNGPILSRIYSLINREILGSDMDKWAASFTARDGNDFRLKLKPDTDFLSDWEIEALDHGFKLISDLAKEGPIVAPLHKRWPEWKDPSACGAGSLPIALEEILAQLFPDTSEVKRIADEVRSVNQVKTALHVGA